MKLSGCFIILLIGLIFPVPWLRSDTHTFNIIKKATFTKSSPLVLLDFDEKMPVTKFGGMWGVFDFNPQDQEAYCRTTFVRDKDLHKKGYHLKVAYDVDSNMTAFNGVWIRLDGLDLNHFEAVSMKVKGDPEKGYTDFFKMELKDSRSNIIEYYIEDITDQWKEHYVPFDEFIGMLEDMKWDDMYEFVPCVFEDWRFKKKEGRIYIDDIKFIPKNGKKIMLKDVLGIKWKR
ncbi:MAG: hypothetical protein JW827_07695 [Spirochaetes bacterium]|nr:hypothetical protein [Spirochaetota bacterium]